MPLSMTDTCERVAVLIEQGLEANLNVYRPSRDDQKKLPDGIGSVPAALVLPGETIDYILQAAQQRHTYYLRVLLCFAGGDIGFAAANGLPYLDALLAIFEKHVTLTGRATSCVFERQTGFSTIEWGGVSFPGWEIFLVVSEESSAAAEPGGIT